MNCQSAGKVVKHGTVTCVGYTDIESRMGTTASYLFGGNVTNLLLSMEDKVLVILSVNYTLLVYVYDLYYVR